MNENLKIDIIIPSFNDYRIFRTIYSVYNCLGSDKVRLIIIDGKSNEQLTNSISQVLRSQDILISEKDRGIFDALNKGIDNCSNDFIFWLGSDDFMATDFNFNNVISLFEDSEIDCIVYKTVFFNNCKPIRELYISKMNALMYKMGFHIPHFSSFWKTIQLKKDRFDLRFSIASGVDFFYKQIVLNKAKVICVEEVSTYMELGGTSTKNIPSHLRGLKEVYEAYQRRQGWLQALLAVVVRYSWKIGSKSLKKEYPIIKHLSVLLLKSYS